jgi:hypothetical protein
MGAIRPPFLYRREQKPARLSTTFTFISSLGRQEISKTMMRYTPSLKNSIQSNLIFDINSYSFVEKLQIMDRSSFAATAERYKKEIDKDFPDGKFIQTL